MFLSKKIDKSTIFQVIIFSHLFNEEFRIEVFKGHFLLNIYQG